MHVRIPLFRTPLLALALAGAPFAAKAEPQILALVATGAPTPLICEAGECAIETSAFCMEPARLGPDHATTYLAPADADIRLVARFADGRERRVAAGPLATFVSQRGYAAVRVSVPESLKAELGAESLSLEVGEQAALLPKPLPRYKKPHRPEEIAAALGVNRELGAGIVDRAADGARAMSVAVNALPRERRESAEERRDAAAALDEAPEARVGTGRPAAQRALGVCLLETARDSRFSLRECLQHAHDRAMWELNRRYWQAVSPTG
jgi:hypothetical protein